MDKPLAMKKGRERVSRPGAVEKAISGFRHLRQKTGPLTGLGVVLAIIVLALPGPAVSRSSSTGGATSHSAAPHVSVPHVAPAPGAGIVHPASPSAVVPPPSAGVAPGPTAVRPPASPVTPMTTPSHPGTTPPVGTATAPAQQNPAYSDFSCRAGCGEQCQRVACPGLDVSECLSVRQKCRLSCESAC